jgi:energy-converting hydrogenase A subunit M
LNVTGFIWLEDIVEKLWRKHRVEQREVAEVFGGAPHFRSVEKGHRAGENVYAALGQTDGGAGT